MGLHTLTRSSLNNPVVSFSEELQTSIKTILDLIDNYSAISDINFLLYKYDKEIPGITLPGGDAKWLPTRNLARLLAKIASLELDGTIEKINLDSMYCGCDYFEGNLFFMIDGRELGGPYKWQWTAFSDNQRHFDKFTLFPELETKLTI